MTTALIGNCGVTFAPVAEANRRYLAELMESVEDIAADAIMDGLPWSWTTYGEYLDAVQDCGPALNMVGLVGHSDGGSGEFPVVAARRSEGLERNRERPLDSTGRQTGYSCLRGAVGSAVRRLPQQLAAPERRLDYLSWRRNRPDSCPLQGRASSSNRDF